MKAGGRAVGWSGSLLISLLSPLPRPIANLAHRLFRGLASSDVLSLPPGLPSGRGGQGASASASQIARVRRWRPLFLAFCVTFVRLVCGKCAFLRAKDRKEQTSDERPNRLPFSLALACLESIHPERPRSSGCRGHCTARPMRSVTGGGSSAETCARCECQCVVECQCLS